MYRPVSKNDKESVSENDKESASNTKKSKPKAKAKSKANKGLEYKGVEFPNPSTRSNSAPSKSTQKQSSKRSFSTIPALHKQEEDYSSCLICFKPTCIWTLGHCGHRTMCGVCGIRNRALFANDSCPLCKSNLSNVIITSLPESFSDLESRPLHFDHQWKVYYVFEEEFASLLEMREPKCRVCELRCASLTTLKQHVEREHNLQFCSVCLDQRKVFLSEQRVYEKKVFLPTFLPFLSVFVCLGCLSSLSLFNISTRWIFNHKKR